MGETKSQLPELYVFGEFSLPSYAFLDLPATARTGSMVYVTNMTGGAEPAFFDGTNWRRCSDRTVAS